MSKSQMQNYISESPDILYIYTTIFISTDARICMYFYSWFTRHRYKFGYKIDAGYDFFFGLKNKISMILWEKLGKASDHS